ncbi:hypothetical protein LLE49_24410 [Alicyclobacillus tolerans]|uniref:hypothetical protein n=1 Tax=Alicyclobacillus tolerans TaxID=90970 RepID=UPI001F1F4601|nr:hypothetical protein [Alicyclobacillus tolerans]MCF8567869.1 hypothetical protein [Alicyclobacillus tolerans]
MTLMNGGCNAIKEPNPTARKSSAAPQILVQHLYPWLIFAAIGLWIMRPVLFHPYTQVIGGIPDSFQYTWYLGWFWHAVSHGLNPFYSYELNWPLGFGLMYNTSVIAESALFGWLVPLTSPVFVYNLVFFANIAAVGLMGRAVLRELGVGHWLSTWGGAMFCFMPYLTAQELGHTSQYFVAPLFAAVLLLIRFINRTVPDGMPKPSPKLNPKPSPRPSQSKPLRPIWTGVGIGILCAVEFYTSLELTVTFALATALFISVLVLQRQGRTFLATRIGSLPQRLWLSIFVTTLLLILPGIAEFVSAGGLLFSNTELHPDSGTFWVADLLSPLYPTPLQAMHTALTANVTQQHFLGDPEERGNYVGVFLLAAMVVLRKAWTGPVSRSLFGLSLTMFVLSLGNQVHVFGHPTPIYLPWLLFSHVPFLKSALPIRLALYVDASLIVWTALSLQEVQRTGGTRQAPPSRWIVPATALLSLASWVPVLWYPHARAYFLPQSVVNKIGLKPVYWIGPNFGYDMQPLASSGYRLKTYNMYGFVPFSALGTQSNSPLASFVYNPGNNLSIASWSESVKAMQTELSNLSSGYVLLTDFNPSGVQLPPNLYFAVVQTLGKPVYQSQGCELWQIK